MSGKSILLYLDYCQNIITMSNYQREMSEYKRLQLN